MAGAGGSVFAPPQREEVPFEWFGESYSGPNRPLAARRGKRTSWSEDLEDAASALRGMHDMGASTLRGAVRDTLGLPGDIESLVRSGDALVQKKGQEHGLGWLTGSGTDPEKDRVFPTSEEIGKKSWMPPVNPGQKESPFEDIGGIIGLPGAGTAIVKGGRTVLKKAAPTVQALRDVDKVSEAEQASRRGFLKTAGVTTAAATGVLGSEALVKALRSEKNVARVAAKKAPKHVSHRVIEKMDEYHKYDALDDPDVWGQASKPYTPGELIDIGRTDFPGKTDDEILHIYERLLDAEPGVKSGPWGTKEFPKEVKDKFGVGAYDVKTGLYDETEANIAKDIIEGRINPRDYKAGTFDRFDWGNTDYWDHRHVLNGHIDESIPSRPVTKEAPNTMPFAEREEYFKRLEGEHLRRMEVAPHSKPQSIAPTGDDALKAILMAASLRDPATRQAKKMLKEGMHPHGVWRETGRELVPGTKNKWAEEIPDTDAKIKAPLLKGDRGEIVPGWYKLSSIFDHPKLYDKLPQFKDTRVVVGPMEEGIWGSFNTDINRLNLNSEIFNGSKPDEDLIGTILHEIQHPIQKEADWPQGANAEMMRLDIGQKMGIRTIKNRGPHTAERKQLLEAIEALQGDPWGMYHYTHGEQQAEVPLKRLGYDEETLKSVPPSANYEDLDVAFPLKEFKKLKKESEHVYDRPARPFSPEEWEKLISNNQLSPQELKALLGKMRRGSKRTVDVHEVGDVNHPTVIENVKTFTNGRKKSFDELTDTEVEEFLAQGLDEGLF